MRKAGFAAVLAAMTWGAWAPAAEGARGRVVSVVDGDTVKVRVAGKVRTVELLGADAPERGSCFSRQAAAELRRLLPRRGRVVLESDPAFAGASYVLRAGRVVNVTMVYRGMARASVADAFARADDLRRAERGARRGKRGAWAVCTAGWASPASGAPGTPPAGQPPSGSAADTEAARAELDRYLRGMRVGLRRSTDTTSEQTDFHFCTDGRFYFSTVFISPQGPTGDSREGSWRIHSVTENVPEGIGGLVETVTTTPAGERDTAYVQIGVRRSDGATFVREGDGMRQAERQPTTRCGAS